MMFKVLELTSSLENDGFVKFNLLPKEKVLDLLNIYNSYPNSKNDFFGFHVSLDLDSAEIINKISNDIKKIIQPIVNDIFTNYQFISPRFAVKESNQNSLVPPHQDWSFVDESKFQSYNLWIALTPCTLENGTLGFLSGSHKKLNNIRATPLPIFKVPFHDYAYDLIDNLEYFELQAGDALLFNSRIIHASKPNITNERRINVVTEICDKNAQLKHFNLLSDNKTICEYDIDNSFFTKYSNAKLTKMYHQKESINNYPLVSKFDYKFSSIKIKDLI